MSSSVSIVKYQERRIEHSPTRFTTFHNSSVSLKLIIIESAEQGLPNFPSYSQLITLVDFSYYKCAKYTEATHTACKITYFMY